jgi:hypothetical protein
MNLFNFFFVSQEVFKHSWLIQDYWACSGYWVAILWSLPSPPPTIQLLGHPSMVVHLWVLVHSGRGIPEISGALNPRSK